MEELIKGLNERQRLAVTHRETDVLQVLAGPGTGKTKVLTARFAYLVTEKKIHPLRIIMTTFTKKAANEIKERLQPILKEVGISADGLLIGTFHSICSRILRQAGHLINIPKNWSIAKSEDFSTVIKTILEDMPEYIIQSSRFTTELLDKRQNVNVIRNKIADLKSKGITPQIYLSDSTSDPAISYIYEHLQKMLLSEALLDFDDILLYTKILLENHTVWPFIKHVLVDEFQDTNDLQLELVYLLSRGSHGSCSGITAVGDPDQSIYGFRFASSDNFLKLKNRSPVEFNQVSLIENYRSAQSLLNFSDNIISQQLTERIKREPLKGQYDHRLKPFFSHFERTDSMENNETNGIAHEIIYLLSLPNLYKYSDISILVRTRRQVYDIEKSLLKRHIPYKVINSKAIWERKESGMFLDYLRVISQKHTTLATLRCLQFSTNGIGPATVKIIKQFMDSHNGECSFDALKTLCNSKTLKGEKIMQALCSFVTNIEKLQKACQTYNSYDDMKELFVQIYVLGKLYLVLDGTTEELDKKIDENKSRMVEFLESEHPTMFKIYEIFTEYQISNTDELISIKNDSDNLDDLELVYENHDNININILEVLNLFVKSVALYASEEEDFKNKSQRSSEPNEKVTVSTIHAAKGLEWPVVFIPSINEGLIPFTDKSARQRLEDLAELRQEDRSEGDESDELVNNSTKQHLKEKEEEIMDDMAKILNEERRIFFVAITRAKHLLYLSSSGKKSVFLEKCEPFYSQNTLLNDKETIEKFYNSIQKTLKEEPLKISLNKLCEDYRKYKKRRSKDLIWNGEVINSFSSIDFSCNTKPINSIGVKHAFKPASSLLSINSPTLIKNNNSTRPNTTSDVKRGETSSSNKNSDTLQANNKKRRVCIDMIFAKKTNNELKPVGKLSPKNVLSASNTTVIKPNAPKNYKVPKTLSTPTPGKQKSYAPAYTPVRNNAAYISKRKGNTGGTKIVPK